MDYFCKTKNGDFWVSDLDTSQSIELYYFKVWEQHLLDVIDKYVDEGTFAIDAGALYRIDVLNELRLGASISNFGTKMKMDGRDIQEIKQVGSTGTGNLIDTKVILEEWDIPLLFRVGPP